MWYETFYFMQFWGSGLTFYKEPGCHGCFCHFMHLKTVGWDGSFYREPVVVICVQFFLEIFWISLDLIFYNSLC